MPQTDIKNRPDISQLVHAFYDKVRKDEQIGDFFNTQIKDWPAHMEKLTDFWESTLFLKRKYKGNPLAAHQVVDEKSNYTVEQRHFGIWLNLWYQTIDELFEGETANRAKRRARKMSTFMFIGIFENRQQKK